MEQAIAVRRGVARESLGWSIALSVLLIVAGLLAIAAPLMAGVAVTGIIGWLILFGGAVHLWLAFHVRGTGAHFYEVIIGLLYLFLGIFLLMHPLAGLITLTGLLGIYLVFKGVFELIGGFMTRGVAGTGWLLFDGVVSLILAVIIWRHLLFSSTWVVGTLIGFAILFSGVTRLALALSARRSHAAMV